MPSDVRSRLFDCCVAQMWRQLRWRGCGVFVEELWVPTFGDVVVTVATLVTSIVLTNCVVLAVPTEHVVVLSPSLLKTNLSTPVWV